MSNVLSYSVCIAIFQYSVFNISISTRHRAFIFNMYNVCKAGNCLVKFALITDSHLLDINSQSWPHLKNGGQRKNNIPKKGHTNLILLLHFLIEDISVDKCSKNLNGIFCFKEFTSVPKMINFEGISRNFEMSTFWEMISLEQFDQGGWFYFYLYSFLHRFQKI